MSYYNEYGAFYEEHEEFHGDLKEILGKVESENSNNNESIEVSLAVKKKQTMKNQKNKELVKSYIEKWGKVSKLNKKYYKFGIV